LQRSTGRSRLFGKSGFGESQRHNAGKFHRHGKYNFAGIAGAYSLESSSESPPANLLLLAFTSLAMLLLAAGKRRKLSYSGVLAATVLGMAILMTACGGGGSTPPPPPAPHGTPVGTSTLVVTAASGTATRTFNLTLNVN